MTKINEIPKLRNFGPESGKMLNQIGIYNLNDLKKSDLVDVYLCLEEIGTNVSLNMLWAMVGAVMDIDWRDVPIEIKDELKDKIKTKSIKTKIK